MWIFLTFLKQFLKASKTFGSTCRKSFVEQYLPSEVKYVAANNISGVTFYRNILLFIGVNESFIHDSRLFHNMLSAASSVLGIALCDLFRFYRPEKTVSKAQSLF